MSTPIHNIQRLYIEIGFRAESARTLPLDERLIEVLACEQIAVAIEANEREMRETYGDSTRWNQAKSLLARTRSFVRKVRSATKADDWERRTRDSKLWAAVEKRRKELERLHGLMTAVPATSENRGSRSYRGVGRSRDLPI